MICHGQGDETIGGCCWINGAVCPHRWRIDASAAATTRDALIYDSNDVLLGTVDDYVKSVHNGRPRQDRVVDVIQGSIWVCGVLANTVIADGIPTGANWEDDFDAAWSAEYAVGGTAEDVGDAWEAIGKPRNWCVSYGPDLNQCCFKEDQQTNDQKAANLTTTRVMIGSRSTLGG